MDSGEGGGGIPAPRLSLVSHDCASPPPPPKKKKKKRRKKIKQVLDPPLSHISGNFDGEHVIHLIHMSLYICYIMGIAVLKLVNCLDIRGFYTIEHLKRSHVYILVSIFVLATYFMAQS